jgi:hypothetical protein
VYTRVYASRAGVKRGVYTRTDPPSCSASNASGKCGEALLTAWWPSPDMQVRTEELLVDRFEVLVAMGTWVRLGAYQNGKGAASKSSGPSIHQPKITKCGTIAQSTFSTTSRGIEAWRVRHIDADLAGPCVCTDC